MADLNVIFGAVEGFGADNQTVSVLTLSDDAEKSVIQTLADCSTEKTAVAAPALGNNSLVAVLLKAVGGDVWVRINGTVSAGGAGCVFVPQNGTHPAFVEVGSIIHALNAS